MGFSEQMYYHNADGAAKCAIINQIDNLCEELTTTKLKKF